MTDFDAGLLQLVQAAPRHLRIGILHRRDHPRHAGGHQRIGAGRRAAVVAARFERDIGSGAARLVARHAQRVHFRMRLAGAQMIAFTDNFAVAHDNAADVRIGRGGETPQPRQFEGARHVKFVVMHERSFSLAGGQSLHRTRARLRSCGTPTRSECRPPYPAFSARPSPDCRLTWSALRVRRWRAVGI